MLSSLAKLWRSGLDAAAGGRSGLSPRTGLTKRNRGGRGRHLSQTRRLSTPAGDLEVLESRALLAVVPQGFTETEIASRLSSPTAMQIAPDGRIFVGQQNGVIRLIQNDQLQELPMGSVPADGSGERGVQGMALDPDFEQNGYLYLNYTRAIPASHNVISRITIQGNEMVPGSEQILYELPNLSTVGNPIWHMGGSIEVTPDGYILFAVGDHQRGELAQDMNSPFGKMMRIAKDGSIPTDNPFYNSTQGALRAIWSLGLRNPFTGAVQAETGKYFVNDVGAGSWEEVNQVARGANFGWPGTEGYFNQSTNPNFTQPVHAYSHSVGCAITGGTFYPQTSGTFPDQYAGQYYFSEFCSGEIRQINPTNGAQSRVFLSGAAFPMGIEVSSDGAMYYIQRGVGAGGADGTSRGSVHKVEYVAEVPPRIAEGPANLLIPVGEGGAFAVSASGTRPLTYQWQRATATGEFADITGATDSAYSFNTSTLEQNNDRFRVVVSNAFGSVTSGVATLRVTADQRPTAQIQLPATGTRYNAGDVINFAGIGTDAVDGNIPPERMTWLVNFHHHTHNHPFLPVTSGISGGQFTIPVTGETDPDVFYRISLTVADSQGLTSSTFVDVIPNLANIRLESSLAGVSILLDGQPKATPFAVDGVVNIQRTVEAPEFFSVGGQGYEFDRWEGGNTNRRVEFATPVNGVTWRALYKTTSVVFVSDLPYATTPTNGWGVPERDRSNGELGDTDGNPITLQGQVFSKGMGVHADGEIAFNLNSNFTRFKSTIGVDDETGDNGSVIFRVLVDNVVRYTSPVMRGNSDNIDVDVDVSNALSLKLQVLDAGDGNGYDHADWAQARLILKPATTTVPAAPSGFSGEGLSGSTVQLKWFDNSNNETGFRLERRTYYRSLIPGDTPPPWSLVAELPANTTQYLEQNSGLSPTTLYEYRVAAFNVVGSSPQVETTAATDAASTIHVNFQPLTAPAFAGYLVDGGQVFGARNGQNYGWNANNAGATRDRENPASADQRYDTLIHLQKPENPNASWEIALPNGFYSVRIVGGDPTFADGRMNTLAEGVEVIDGSPTAAAPFVSGTANVNVTDGRLTITNGPDAVNNKLAFLEIRPALVATIDPTVVIPLDPIEPGGPRPTAVAVMFSAPVQGLDVSDLRLIVGGQVQPVTAADARLIRNNGSVYLFGFPQLNSFGKKPVDVRLVAVDSGIMSYFGQSLLGDATGVYRLPRPGDADLDGDVDINDFVILRNNFGGSTNLAADFNADGRVDINDFIILRNNFGKP